MKEIVHRSAGFGAVILALVLVLLVYVALGSVDLVFMKGDFQVARMENVRVYSDIQLDVEDVITGEELEYTYGEDAKPYEANMDLRVEIAKTLVFNLLNVVKGEPVVEEIVFTAN